jgi:2-polyprenyl-3-methyl-5-hydroxy-6-metoxy-1,4-benzoquinol methylase
MLKYTANPDRYSSHERILAMLQELPAGSSILDVGSASGYFGERLAGRGYHVVGVEQDEASASIAAAFYDEFIVADIESGLPLSRKFDVILLADILEHLRQPLKVLVHLRDYLSSRGKFVISVPNVANIYVRLSLFFGRFDYTDRGILDETHLRFFTLKSVCALMQRASLRVKQIVVTPIPLPLVLPSTREGASCYFLHRANWALTQMWKKLFAYQFIIVADPSVTGVRQ